MSFGDDQSLGTPSTMLAPDTTGIAAPGSGGEPLPIRPRMLTKWRVLSSIVVLFAALVIAASLITVPYYALTPGTAQNVEPLIGVPASVGHSHTGAVDLVDVEVTPLRLIDWLWFKLNSQATIISSQAIQGPETTAQYNTEGVLDMASAQQAATIVALRQLGYSVSFKPNGALVYALDPGSPADSSLLVGDVVVGVGAGTVSGPEPFSAALSHYHSGDLVTVTVRAYPSQSVKKVPIRLGTWRLQGTGANAQIHCVPSGEKTSWPALNDVGGNLVLPKKGQPAHPVGCLGILSSEASYAISKLPFKVDLNNEGIVGPSAGLAFTLGLMQRLDSANLTDGLQVAATGTMSISGQVGAIGGIEQKTFAVRSAGASIFLVPPANYAEAKKYAGPTLKVYAVSTIAQAIKVLESHGGKIARPAGP